MTLETKIPSPYSRDFEKNQTETASPQWVSSLRSEAWKEFERLGFPSATRGNELWKYTSIRQIDRSEFSIPDKVSTADTDMDALRSKIPWSDSWATVTFVDGFFSPELSRTPSSEGLYVGRLSDALHEKRNITEPLIGKIAPHSNDPFISLNTAFIDDGMFMEVSDNAKIEAPVQVLHILTEQFKDAVIYPRTLAVCGKNSEITLIESYINLSSERNLTVPVLEVLMRPGSTMRHNRIQLEGERAFHISMGRVLQTADTNFTSTSFATAPSIGRYDIHTQLDEPGAECTIHGLYLTSGRQHQRNEISTTHKAPHCKSRQFFKGVLSGSSRAVFSGKIVVDPDAQKTEADQKDLNLLLSYGAEIDTKPSLEIYADDVKCAHGATAGHVDKSVVFYMQSRGLDMNAARSMLVKGFASEIVDKFEDASVRKFAEDATEAVLPAMLKEADLAMPRTI